MNTEPPTGDDLQQMLVSMKREVLTRADQQRPAPRRRGRRAGIVIGVIAVLGIGATSGGVALGMIPQPFAAAPAPSPSATTVVPSETPTPSSAPVVSEPTSTPTPTSDTCVRSRADRPTADRWSRGGLRAPGAASPRSASRPQHPGLRRRRSLPRPPAVSGWTRRADVSGIASTSAQPTSEHRRSSTAPSADGPAVVLRPTAGFGLDHAGLLTRTRFDTTLTYSRPRFDLDQVTQTDHLRVGRTASPRRPHRDEHSSVSGADAATRSRDPTGSGGRAVHASTSGREARCGPAPRLPSGGSGHHRPARAG